MGVRLHTTIDFFGLKEAGEAHGLAALIKQKGAEARVEDCPALVPGGISTAPIRSRIDHLYVIIAATDEGAAQQKLQEVYTLLNASGPDYEVTGTRCFNGDTYREVI